MAVAARQQDVAEASEEARVDWGAGRDFGGLGRDFLVGCGRATDTLRRAALRGP